MNGNAGQIWTGYAWQGKCTKKDWKPWSQDDGVENRLIKLNGANRVETRKLTQYPVKPKYTKLTIIKAHS